MNQLANEDDIKEYKEYLSTRPYHFLRSFLINFEMDKTRKIHKYPKLELRITLVNEEMERRKLTGECK